MNGQPLRLAYADPPYLGQCARYDHEHGASGECWDDLATYAHLIDNLCTFFPDGWALSGSAPSLPRLLSGTVLFELSAR